MSSDFPPARVNVFSGNPLDRAGDRRGDAAWLSAQLEHPAATALALWNGQPLVTDGEDGAAASARLPGAMARGIVGPEAVVFLGLAPDGPVLAIDLDHAADPAQGVLRGHGRFAEMRSVLQALPPGDANLLGAARSLFEWRRRHRFCSVCGHATETSDGGWRRVCPNCKAQHFPRVDPCVIMLPVRGERCLVGRQAAWPAGRFSALAGFVEPGESMEEACAREVKEESGLTVTGARYHSSQPWPFPSNLMLGMIAEVAEGEAMPDLTELEAVRWLTREEARAMVEGKLEGILAPPRAAIAHHLIRDWAFEAL